MAGCVLRLIQLHLVSDKQHGSQAHLYSVRKLSPKSVGLKLLFGKADGLATTPTWACGLKIMLHTQFESEKKKKEPRTRPMK